MTVSMHHYPHARSRRPWDGLTVSRLHRGRDQQMSIDSDTHPLQCSAYASERWTRSLLRKAWLLCIDTQMVVAKWWKAYRPRNPSSGDGNAKYVMFPAAPPYGERFGNSLQEPVDSGFLARTPHAPSYQCHAPLHPGMSMSMYRLLHCCLWKVVYLV